MVTPHSLRQLCFGPAAAQIDPARSARSRPFRDRLIPPNQSVTEIIIVFPAFFVNTQMKIFRLLTAFSASFFLPCPQGDFSLFSLCRLLNLPRRELPFARGFAPPPPGGFCKAVSSCDPLCRRSARAWQSHARHPGDFPVAGKVTKGAPRAAPFGIPRCVVAALFALAALRSVSRRATFCHKNRPICHFELSGQIGLVFSFGFIEGTLCVFNPWLGGWDAPEDA